MQTDNLNKYIGISLVIHAFFLMTITTSNIQRDISQIGEQGMQIQMVLIRDQNDDVQDDDSLSTSEKKIIKSEEKTAKIRYFFIIILIGIIKYEVKIDYIKK